MSADLKQEPKQEPLDIVTVAALLWLMLDDVERSAQHLDGDSVHVREILMLCASRHVIGTPDVGMVRRGQAMLPQVRATLRARLAAAVAAQVPAPTLGPVLRVVEGDELPPATADEQLDRVEVRGPREVA